MNILLVYPRYPDTFWSFRHALKFISRKAAYVPLGLLTVSSLLPPWWNKKLVDLNTGNLKDEDIAWADYVFIGAMDVQRDSTEEIIGRCILMNKKIVAGGPLFITCYDDFLSVDHLVLGEAEAVLPLFLADLAKGQAQHLYLSLDRPDIRESPVPDWKLIDPKKYATLSLQYSRGCPYDCEFCDVVLLNGRVPRAKDSKQLLAELNELYRLGARDSVFVVDDNFIGNKKKVKEDILPAIIAWMREKDYPFTLLTQVSINLTDDEELMGMMVDAGFNTVFVGIETPNEESLGECGKHQNMNRDLLASVRTLHRHGMQVQGGFIVGFDKDPPDIFEKQIGFIQQSGIAVAMVGLLNAPRGTKLHDRLAEEGRLSSVFSGNNTDMSLNFVPKMGQERLVSGYKRILAHIYSCRHYYERVGVLLRDYRPRSRGRIRLQEIRALLKSLWYLGIIDKGRYYYWMLLGSTLLRRPRSFPMAVKMAIFGYHFRACMTSAASRVS